MEFLVIYRDADGFLLNIIDPILDLGSSFPQYLAYSSLTASQRLPDDSLGNAILIIARENPAILLAVEQ